MYLQLPHDFAPVPYAIRGDALLQTAPHPHYWQDREIGAVWQPLLGLECLAAQPLLPFSLPLLLPDPFATHNLVSHLKVSP